jgi:hypothetical protein
VQLCLLSALIRVDRGRGAVSHVFLRFLCLCITHTCADSRLVSGVLLDIALGFNTAYPGLVYKEQSEAQFIAHAASCSMQFQQFVLLLALWTDR